MTARVQKAIAIILEEIRTSTADDGEIVIPCEDISTNVTVFLQALESPEVKLAASRRGVRLRLDIKYPLDQARQHLLNQLAQARQGVNEIVFPCYLRDAHDYERALALPEVKQAFEVRGIVARLQVVDPAPSEPEIIVATYQQIVGADFDKYLDT